MPSLSCPPTYWGQQVWRQRAPLSVWNSSCKLGPWETTIPAHMENVHGVCYFHWLSKSMSNEKGGGEDRSSTPPPQKQSTCFVMLVKGLCLLKMKDWRVRWSKPRLMSRSCCRSIVFNSCYCIHGTQQDLPTCLPAYLSPSEETQGGSQELKIRLFKITIN